MCVCVCVWGGGGGGAAVSYFLFNSECLYQTLQNLMCTFIVLVHCT